MGWGDRLNGFYVPVRIQSCMFGVDARRREPSYLQRKNDYYEGLLTMFETMKKVDLYCEAAEDFYYDGYDDTFDIIFTSPPFSFNVRYSHDDNQRVGLDTRILIAGILSSYTKLLTTCYLLPRNNGVYVSIYQMFMGMLSGQRIEVGQRFVTR